MLYALCDVALLFTVLDALAVAPLPVHREREKTAPVPPAQLNDFVFLFNRG